MALTAKKQDTDVAEHEAGTEARVNETVVIDRTVEAFDGQAVLSPARALQDRLSAHFAPVSRTMSSRFVTLFIMFAVLGTWVSATGVNTGLQV